VVLALLLAAAPPDFVVIVGKSEVHAKTDGELLWAVLGPLLHDYAKQQKLEPSNEQLDRMIAKEHQKNLAEAARRPELEKQLAAAKTDEERKAVQLQIDILPGPEVLAVEVSKDPHVREEMRRVQRDFALYWNVQKQLHKQYGGAVIFQQMGPESVGAYAPFLEEHEKKGDFKIPDADTRSRFWALARKINGVVLSDKDPFAKSPFE